MQMLRRKSAEDRRAEIVSAVLDLADRQGPDRMTVGEVAQAVGLSQPGVFRHFATKSALWVAVAEQIGIRLSEAWDRAAAADDRPEARIRALVLAQLGQIEAMPALPSILFSRELNMDNPDLRGAFFSLLAAFQRHLATALAEAQVEGTVRRDVDPGDAAVFLTSLVQGLAIRWTLGARKGSLTGEGARLVDVQMALLAPGLPK